MQFICACLPAGEFLGDLRAKIECFIIEIGLMQKN
jgi:hypothetical protein